MSEKQKSVHFFLCVFSFSSFSSSVAIFSIISPSSFSVLDVCSFSPPLSLFLFMISFAFLFSTSIGCADLLFSAFRFSRSCFRFLPLRSDHFTAASDCCVLCSLGLQLIPYSPKENSQQSTIVRQNKPSEIRNGKWWSQQRRSLLPLPLLLSRLPLLSLRSLLFILHLHPVLVSSQSSCNFFLLMLSLSLPLF